MAPDDLPPLSPELERLLAAERAAPGPSPELMARVASRLDATIASAGAQATTSAVSMKATAATVTGASAVKWLTAALAAAGLTTAGWFASRPSGEPATSTEPAGHGGRTPAPGASPRAAAPAPIAAAPSAAPPSIPALPTAAVPQVRLPSADARDAEGAGPRSGGRRPIEVSVASPPTTSPRVEKRHPPAVNHDAERTLLSRARSALRAGDIASTFRLLSEHRRSHPRGALVEEREALRVLALAARGDREAAVKAAERFHARYRNSVHEGAIRAALSR